MSGHDDDLAPWHDDPVVRALRGPGTSDELAGEAEFRAAFRAAQPAAPASLGAARLRRAGRRLGGGGTAVVVALALGAGAAAAAYTQNLPEPVQRAVHGVLGPVGVPAPKAPKPSKEPQADPTTSTPAAPDDTESPTEQPASPSDSPTDEPGSSPTDKPSDSPTESPSDTPTDAPSPTESPTTTPTEAPPVPPANVSLGGTSHRAGPDEQVPLTGTVTTADSTPVAGQDVSLLQKQGASWVAVATAASDSAGTVSFSAPALLRTSVFRFGVGDTIASDSWRIVLVPTLSMTSAPGGSGTGIEVTARGGQPGDLVSLLTRRPGKDVLVGRSRLAADLTTTFQVAAPQKRVTFVAQLPRSRAHAAARSSQRVQPVKPTTLTAAVPDPILAPGESVTVSGTASGAGGVVLPGRQVVLMMKAAGGDWRQVGSAVSDVTGSVAIPMGPISANASVRLRTGKVVSPAIGLKLQPLWTTSVSRSGDGATISGTAAGGNAGNPVLLRKYVAGRLSTVAQGVLGADRQVSFDVALPEGRRDRYRLVLDGTPSHLRAMGAAVVTR